MAIFAITFRIDSDSTYAERYESLVKEIKNQALDEKTWDEPTSFVLIDSNSSSSEICKQLYLNSKISESKDTLLVVNLSQKNYAQKGAKYPNTLESFMTKR